MKMKKVLAIVLVVAIAAALCIAFAACGDKGDSDQFTLGLITLHDSNSTYDKNFIDAANDAAKELGFKVIIKSGIPEGNECYEAAIDLIEQGCDAIFADSFGHEEFILKAAKEYPNIQFAHATGTMAHTEKLANFHNAFAAIYEGRYLAGIAAGMKLNEMITAGTITAEQAVMGYVGAYPYAEVKSGYTSFYLGAKSVCPSVTMKVAFTNSWYSANREKEAANSLMASGCVLMSQHADSMGAPAACELANVPDVTYNLSTKSDCPNTYLAGSKINWRIYFKHMYEAITTNDESFKTEYDWTGTIQNGAVEFIALGNHPAEGTQAAIDAATAAFKAGTLKVFDTASFTVTRIDTGVWATSKNLNATVDENGKLVQYKADVDSDPAYTADTDVVDANGIFQESKFRSAPYFDADIDGITIVGTFDQIAE